MSGTSDSSILPAGWSWSDVGHGALDLAGLVPLYGEAADLANATWYAGEGQYLESGLSLISCVPVIGDVVGKGGKLALRSGKKLAGPALDLIKKMDFQKALGGFRNNPKLGPHMDKIIKALEEWRAKMTGELGAKAAGPITHCPYVEKMALDVPTKVLSKTPVPTEILEKLTTEQMDTMERALKHFEDLPLKPAKDKAVFYSGDVGGKKAWMVVRDMAQKDPDGVHWISGLGGDFVNAKHLQDGLPNDALAYLEKITSSKLAQNASGKISVVGDVPKMSPNGVFRQVEIPALLENTAVDAESKKKLREMASRIDSNVVSLPKTIR